LPTIHLSVPESMYRELKREAEKMGVQVTDIVKMFIKQGLNAIRREEERRKAVEYASNNQLAEIMKAIEGLRKDIEARLTYLEGRLFQLNSIVEYVVSKVEEFEEARGEEVEPEVDATEILVTTPPIRSKHRVTTS